MRITPRSAKCVVMQLTCAMVFGACHSTSTGPAGLSPYAYAFATATCGPADGPAMSIFLTATPSTTATPPMPYVQVYLWHAPGELAGGTWDLNTNGADGSANRCIMDTPCDAASSGRVTLGAFAADSSLPVQLSLAFGDGTTIHGSLRATWKSNTSTCG